MIILTISITFVVLASYITNANYFFSYLCQWQEDKIAVLVGPVTDDIRVHDIPAIKVAALRFTERARARIEKAGGECLTFDQLALRAPLGQNTVIYSPLLTLMN